MTTIVVLTGEQTPQFVAIDTCLTVECRGADLWAFRG